MKIDHKFARVDDISHDFLSRFIEPYKPNCKYLKSAQFQYPEQSNMPDQPSDNGQGMWYIKGNFTIPESCYIADTGHFNAVEFNICYNQLCYVMIACLLKNRLLEIVEGWDLENYKSRQLRDFLIAKYSSSFKQQINAKAFQATLAVNQYSTRANLSILKTSIAFYDDNDGWAEGDITIAILNGK